MEVTEGQFTRSEDIHVGRQAHCEECRGEIILGEGIGGDGWKVGREGSGDGRNL